MNHQFDIIIIGDSQEGHTVLKQVASTRPTIKIAFVSREFKTKTTHDFINLEYIRNEVIFTDYKNRLFGCYLKNGDRLYSTHLVIATGISYAPLLLDNKAVPGVFNTTSDISKLAKNLQAVVLCNSEADVKLALAVAKKYKYVYLCTKTFRFCTSGSLKKRLAETPNIAVLPNAWITKVVTQNGVLTRVELRSEERRVGKEC